MRVHLIDGTWELFRAHYSKRPSHRDDSGRDRKATVGVVQSLLQLLQEPGEAVNHVAAAFDNPIRSFRNQLFAGYKTEEGMPPELLAQLDPVEEAVASLGVTVWSMKDFEADDALATAAARFAPTPGVQEVRVLSPDKDLAACLVEGRPVTLVNRLTGKQTRREDFQRERGFSPDSVPDFLALVGDTADGIPGLEGWGEKSAAAVLGAHPRLEDIPPDPAAWRVQVRGAARLAQSLEAGRADALLYRRLATLRTDAPISPSLEDLAWRGVPQGPFRAWCAKVGKPSLADRVARWA